MDARSLVAACDHWPPLSAVEHLVDAVASSGPFGFQAPLASRMISELASSLPPCTEQTKFTEICFGRNSGLATVVVSKMYPNVGHVLVALSHMHGCADIYLHAHELQSQLGPERLELVQFESLKLKNMTPESKDILPRAGRQSLIVSTSLIQSLVESSGLSNPQSVTRAVEWVCQRVLQKLEKGGYFVFCDERGLVSCFDCVKAMREAGFASVTVCWVERGSFILRARRPNIVDGDRNGRFTNDHDDDDDNDEPFLKGVVKNSIIETSTEPDDPRSGENRKKEASHRRDPSKQQQQEEDSDSDEDEDAEVEVEVSSSGEEDPDGRDDESGRDGNNRRSGANKNSGAKAKEEEEEAEDSDEEEESGEGDDVAIEVQDDSSDDDEDEDVDPEALAAEAAEAAEATKAMAEWARQRAEEKAVAEYKRDQLEKQQQNSEQEEIELIYDALTTFYEDVEVAKPPAVLKQIAGKFLGKRDKLFEFMRRKYAETAQPFVFRRLHEKLNPDDEV